MTGQKPRFPPTNFPIQVSRGYEIWDCSHLWKYNITDAYYIQKYTVKLCVKAGHLDHEQVWQTRQSQKLRRWLFLILVSSGWHLEKKRDHKPDIGYCVKKNQKDRNFWKRQLLPSLLQKIICKVKHCITKGSSCHRDSLCTWTDVWLLAVNNHSLPYGHLGYRAA